MMIMAMVMVMSAFSVEMIHFIIPHMCTFTQMTVTTIMMLMN